MMVGIAGKLKRTIAPVLLLSLLMHPLLKDTIALDTIAIDAIITS